MVNQEDLDKLSTEGTHQVSIVINRFEKVLEIRIYNTLNNIINDIYMNLYNSGFIDITLDEWKKLFKGNDGLPGADGTNGTDGVDGREVLFQIADGYIQWQYQGDTSWSNLVELTSLVGPAGADGVDGIDGKEVTFQVSEGYIQWQYVGDSIWNNLIR